MLIISFFFASLLFFMILAMIIGAPMVPSNPRVGERMIELLSLKKGQRLYDLGSGDGRLLIIAAKKGARAIGIEINPYALLWSWIKSILSGQMTKIQFIWGSYWRINIKNADAVAVYAMPYVMSRMTQKLQTELMPGTRVVSNSFQIPGLKLVKKEILGKDTIYLYRITHN